VALLRVTEATGESNYRDTDFMYVCEISGSHGGEYEVQSLLMMEAARTSETSVDIDLRTRQYIPKYSELHMCSFLNRMYDEQRNATVCLSSPPHVACFCSRNDHYSNVTPTLQ
jgi:hypothetical protein